MPQDERTIGLQTAIRESYDQREVVDRLSLGVRQLAAFLSRFELQSRFVLSQLDGKLEKLERRVGHMESRMATVVPDAAPTHVDDDGGDEEDMQDEDGDQDQQQQQQQ